MKTFREQVREIKLWMILAWSAVILMVVTYVPLRIILFLDNVMNIHINLSSWYLKFIMNMILFGPFVYGGLLVLAGIGIGKRKTCSKCGRNLKVKELEEMGDSFFCPYCFNKKFNDY